MEGYYGNEEASFKHAVNHCCPTRTELFGGTAVANAKQVFIKDHIDHCFDHAATSNPKQLKASLDEFKEITKYLE